jgi:hypothetical protein
VGLKQVSSTPQDVERSLRFSLQRGIHAPIRSSMTNRTFRKSSMITPRNPNKNPMLRSDDQHLRLFDPACGNTDPFEESYDTLDEIHLLNMVNFLQQMVRPVVQLD